MISEVIFVALDFNVQLLDPCLFDLLGSWLCDLRIINLYVVRLSNMLALLNFVVHLFQLLFKSLFLLVFSVFLVLLLVNLLSVHSFLWVVFLTKSQVSELTQNANIFKFFFVSYQLWMSELRSIVGLKIRKLPQKS